MRQEVVIPGAESIFVALPLLMEASVAADAGGFLVSVIYAYEKYGKSTKTQRVEDMDQIPSAIQDLVIKHYQEEVEML